MIKIKVKFITLGCKTNIYESEAMAQLFEEAGYEVVASKNADICVVNTCTVTGTGASKSLKMIRRARREIGNGILIVSGCLAQTEADRLLKEENIDILIGNENKVDVVKLCEEALKGKKIKLIKDARDIIDYEELGIVHRQMRARAEIKIEDGCNNFCTYCKIPYARGPVRSRNIENIKKEAYALYKDGYKEVVLTGIHIGSYGKDLNNEKKLIDVIEAVCSVSDTMNVRLGSIEPVIIDNEFVTRAKKFKNLCPQFHLSLQSGCDKTLKHMNRHYTSSDFKSAVENLRGAFPDCAITTDLIVGFPGETDEDFETSKRFCKDIGFAQMHIFPYSKREGTVAASFTDFVNETEKAKRCHDMLILAADMKNEFMKRYVGKTVTVLFEQEKNGVWTGTTPNYIEVLKKSSENLRGKEITVDILKISDDGDKLLAK